MRRWQFLALLAVVGLVGLGHAAPTQDDKQTPPAQRSPADDLKAIQQEFRQMQMNFSRAYQAAQSKEDKDKVLREQRPDSKPLLVRSLKLAEAHPDSPAAVDALLWTLQVGGATPEARKAEDLLVTGFVAKASLADLAAKLQRVRVAAPKFITAVLSRAQTTLEDSDAPKVLAWVARGGFVEAGMKARQILMEKFVNHDALAEVCQALQYESDKKAAALQLQAILEKSTNPKVQAVACYGLASLRQETGAAGKAEAEKLYERIVTEFGNANKPIANRARGQLNELRGLLSEGKPALAIEGPDLDGKSFKLSDYRGKVVLLDFWGFW
jgi:hypothetical protein